MYKIIIALVVVGWSLRAYWVIQPWEKSSIDKDVVPPTLYQQENAFLAQWLNTNTAQTSVDLSLVLDGWPWKDGIPSINSPQFVTTDDPSNDYLTDDDQGIFVEIWSAKKRYPYAILNRHEIVNDTILLDNKKHHIAVTFCPLCWSAIVFDRTVQWVVIIFGVSGKLYNSNLLMYDDHTESLRSQTRGEAVVGEKLWSMLTVIDSDLITWKDLQTFHPDTQILSTETWIPRNYKNTPYGSYTTNDELYFPVENVTDTRLPLKTPMYIANISDQISIAFVISKLVQSWAWQIDIDGTQYTAKYSDWSYAISWPDGNTIPGYFEMWFSWANKNPRSKHVWGIE